MRKFIVILIGLIFIAGILYLPLPVKGETTDITALIQSLRAQIESLMTRINDLQTQLSVMKEEQKELKQTIVQLTRQLQRGMSGEDVETLQEILATDSEVYPEGLVTGYFGPLTEKAVKKFQEKAGIDQVGRVGPQTMGRLNELLTEGNASGKVPPGLLIAPGIRKKFEEWTFGPLAGQQLPPGIAKKLGGGTPGEPGDSVPPTIYELSATDVATSSAMITWLTDEEADSAVWYDTLSPIVTTGTTSASGVFSSDLVLEHEVGLFDLTPDTTYYYLVISSDVDSNSATSSEQMFDTLAE